MFTLRRSKRFFWATRRSAMRPSLESLTKNGGGGKAYIVPKNEEQVTMEEIIDYLKSRVAKYKIPKYVQFEKDLPLTASGRSRSTF